MTTVRGPLSEVSDGDSSVTVTGGVVPTRLGYRTGLALRTCIPSSSSVHHDHEYIEILELHQVTAPSSSPILDLAITPLLLRLRRALLSLYTTNPPENMSDDESTFSPSSLRMADLDLPKKLDSYTTAITALDGSNYASWKKSMSPFHENWITRPHRLHPAS